jgi:DNA-binding CsgD family transcriptional regulator/cbb3-type cytochrome oxidase subunit 3
MGKWLLLIFAAAFWNAAKSQNTIGIPNIVNYSKAVYKAGNQNFGITQDEKGIMYFANTDGLLSFDGTYWRTYPLPNKTIVRSVAIGKDKRIYVGGQKEIGYFSSGANGDLVYTSLNTILSVTDNDFADVWNISFYEGHVFFRSNKKIFNYYNNTIVTYNSVNWGFLGSASGHLLAYESGKGLLSFKNGQWQPALKNGALPKENLFLRSALPLGGDSILLVSLTHGLFILHNDTLSTFNTPDLNNIGRQNISAACLLAPNRIALFTNLAGCIIISKEGQFVQHFTKKEGIQNNNARIGFQDRDKNLWLGLDNGIDLVTYGNAIKNIFPDTEDRNAGYTAIIHHQQLYLGVASGVYKIKLTNHNPDISYVNGSFEFVKNSEGQVWNLSEVNGLLMMGHNKGGFRIDNDKAVPVDTKTGFWSFRSLPDQPGSIAFAGTYSGINFYNTANGIINPVITTAFESARFIAINKNTIWVAHPYKGIYSITLDKNNKPTVISYKDTKGILSGNHNKIFKLKEKIILTSDKGVFEYDEKEKDFIKAAWFQKLAGYEPISYIKEDESGNIWFCRDGKVGIIDRSFKTPRVFFIPEIDNRIMAAGFENIMVIDSSNVLITAEKGFFHINYALYKKNKLPLHVLIRKVQSPLWNDKVIYGGYDSLHNIPAIAYKYNTLHFECSSTLYGQELNTDFSYYLEGFDKGWSAWSQKREKDYTNIPAGNYTLKVKCRNNVDNESAIVSFLFSILPPWYKTWWAYTLFGLMFIGVLYFFYKRQQRKYKRQQQLKLKEQQRKYAEEQKQLQLQHQIAIQESEKKIIELQNEKLQSEVLHKNTELASSAMNLVRKKEILSKLKEDLVQYKETPEADKRAKEFLKIIRVIDKELDQNEEWEQFAIHFDSVHTNYLKKLTDNFPGLTISDLKLAAYLRLNLTSKEIAQLMNTSIRGVETSRYRLRKKLGLNIDTNLFDFLLKVTA